MHHSNRPARVCLFHLSVAIILTQLYLLFAFVDIAEQLDGLLKSKPTADGLQQLSQEIAQLRKRLVDGTDLLPAYDQRQCEAVGINTVQFSPVSTEICDTQLANDGSGGSTRRHPILCYS